MNFIDLATERYSVRKFDDRPVGRNVIEKIINAGYVAPTACNFQPQRVLVIDNDITLSKLKECTKCHFDAPCAILICYDKNECWKRPYDAEQSGVVDASIVTTHMMLQAWELGIGSTWVMHFNPYKMREVFSIPDNIEAVALLVMGYPASDAQANERHNIYRPIDEIVSYNSF